MTDSRRRSERSAALNRLMTEPTISVYDAMSVLRTGEPTVRRAIANGDIEIIRLGHRIHILSAPLKRQLGIED